MDVLVMVGPVISALEAFPVWGPVLFLVAVALLTEAARVTWGTDAEDTCRDAVPPVPTVLAVEDSREDAGEDTLAPRRVTCGDTDPRVSHWPGTGGG